MFDKVPVVGLAKQEEEIFFPNKPDSLLLPRHSQGLYLVQRIRDEAHRFAITAHRARRTKQGMASALDSLPRHWSGQTESPLEIISVLWIR